MTKEEQRAANRAAMPETAKIVDEYRRVFGDGVRLVWAEENGKLVGQKPEEKQ